MIKDYYRILGVPKEASLEEINAAYRKLAMQHHPDRNPGKEKSAEEKFKEVSEAYGVLSDSTKRFNYDTFGANGNASDILRDKRSRSVFEEILAEWEKDSLDTGFLERIFGDMISEFFVTQDSWFSEGVLGIPIVRDIHCFVEMDRTQSEQGITVLWGKNRKWYELKIPAGVKNGRGIRYRGMGRQVSGLSGDLYFHIIVF